VASRMLEGVGERLSGCAARRLMSNPEGESAASEVSPAFSAGSKVCSSQAVVGGYWSSACDTWVGSWYVRTSSDTVSGSPVQGLGLSIIGASTTFAWWGA